MKEIQSYAGCYELDMGRWWPRSFGGDTLFVTPPSRIELTLERGAEGWAKDYLLIRVAPTQKGMVSGGKGASFWELQPDSRIVLIWTDGFTGVTLKSERRGNDLSGWAYPHFDGGNAHPTNRTGQGPRDQL